MSNNLTQPDNTHCYQQSFPGCPQPWPYPPVIEEDEIDLYQLFLTLKKRKTIVILTTIIGLFLGLCVAIFSPDIYRSTAIIMPTGGQKVPNLGSLGALAGLAGIEMPASASTSEIITLLQTRKLRQILIQKHNLLPIIFYDKWDEEKNTWKKSDKDRGFSIAQIINLPRKLLSNLVKKVHSTQNKAIQQNTKANDIPTIDDCLRQLEGIYHIEQDKKLGTIKVSADFYDPVRAAWLLDILLQTLKDYMSTEAIVTAEKNLDILHKELPRTADPILRQKLQTLIAQNLERKVMAKVNREFAFKVLDPPFVPDQKYKPKRTLIVMVSLVTSLFLGIFLAFFREFIQNMRNRTDDQTPLSNA